MLKRIFSFLGIVALMVLMTGLLTAAAPMPETTFTLVQGLPDTMNVGETATVIVEVSSNVPFLYAQALPSMYFPGRYVVAAAGDHSGKGTTARLEVTFTAKDRTTGVGHAPSAAPVSVVVGVRYPGGVVVPQRFDFTVTVQ
jgi:hypothetical protein